MPSDGEKLRLVPEGVEVTRADGSTRFIPAPTGYSFSHFAQDGSIVGRGQTAVDGWQDWHFVRDGAGFRRMGPAY
jgi:hypothetical protein